MLSFSCSFILFTEWKNEKEKRMHTSPYTTVEYFTYTHAYMHHIQYQCMYNIHCICIQISNVS